MRSACRVQASSWPCKGRGAVTARRNACFVIQEAEVEERGKRRERGAGVRASIMVDEMPASSFKKLTWTDQEGGAGDCLVTS